MSAENDAKLAELRSLPVGELASRLLELVFGPYEGRDLGKNHELSAQLVFGNYSRALPVSLDREDKILFAEALQRLLNREAIALYAFDDHEANYVITRSGRALLERGEHRAALA